MAENKLPFKISILGAVVLVIALWIVSVVAAIRFVGKEFPNLKIADLKNSQNTTKQVVQEESVVTEVVDRVSPSVVTVSAQTPQRRILNFSPFGGFSSQEQGPQQQDIGSGFIVSADGLIVTNKHVVGDASLKYKVITKDNKEYDAKEISRDPSNDLAIIKIDATGLVPITLGDSSNLKAGQFAIAIGTALGEFRNTVTTGVVSGLGRGISAGDPLAGAVEQIDNVIQTDAAINPGNSGGPLLNSSGEVIGINVAVAQGAQNVGFAIPVNTVKDALSQFSANGKFPAKAFLGVQYQMVSAQSAILNNVPQGAYVVEVVAGSAADEAGIKIDDIITEFDGVKVSDSVKLADLINKKKVGDKVSVKIWRDKDTKDVTVTLKEANK